MLSRLGTNPRRVRWLAAGLLSLIWLVVYLTTVSPTVNFIDSGELIVAAHEPGVAHPPGYPLYILLGYVATHIPLGEIAWRLNAFSALFGALAVGAFFLLIFRISEYLLLPERSPRRRAAKSLSPQAAPARGPKGSKPQPGKKQPITARTEAAEQPQPGPVDRAWLLLASATGGASILAASSTFWSRTAQAKMYSLHFFFAGVLFLLAFNYRLAHEAGDNRSARRWLIALGATLGLSFANHLMTLILVLPLGIVALLGGDFTARVRAFLRRLPSALPAFVLPLLLYLYLPIRASQGPVMNWGSTNSWGDFWRHITGWQFRPYLLGDIGGNLKRNTDLVTGYAANQWGLLTVVVIVAALLAGALLARAHMPIFLATAVYALSTAMFSLFYGISEIEPYMTPFYAMLAVWLGLAPAAWLRSALRSGPGKARNQLSTEMVRPALMGAGLITAMAVLSGTLVYPTQNYSRNRLAEQFVGNVFNQLPQNSIVFTDYWDFYAPTYYMQMLKNVRPDIVPLDISLLQYPFYTEQLRLRYPWLIEKSKDIAATFSREQRSWVNGELANTSLLDKSYFDLMTSFAERNQPDHPVFLLMQEDCPPGPTCKPSRIAPTWSRQPQGLVTRLFPQPLQPDQLPNEPEYNLDGILTNPLSLDDVAKTNTRFYVTAYQRLAGLFASAGQSEKAQRMAGRAAAIQAAISGHQW